MTKVLFNRNMREKCDVSCVERHTNMRFPTSPTIILLNSVNEATESKL